MISKLKKVSVLPFLFLRARKLKEISKVLACALTVIMIGLLCFSDFSILTPVAHATTVGSGENGILVMQWEYEMQSLYSTIRFGSSPAIADLLGDSNLEIVTGSDEYTNYYPELGHGANGIWRCFDSEGNIVWAKDTETDESRSSPVIVDIDEDNYLEIVGGTTSGWNVEVMDRFGNFVWTFPWPPKTGGPSMWHSSPAIADVDPDISGLEVFIGNNPKGNVWALDGDNSDGVDDGITATDPWIYGGTEGIDWDVLWKFDTGASVLASPALGDIDNDGQMEVIIGSGDGNVYVLDGITGTMEWSYSTGGAVHSSAAIANLDGDDYLEIIVGSTDGNVHSLEWSGTVGTLEWAIYTGGSVYSSPAIGDIDSDGLLEIVVGSDNGNVYGISPAGTMEWSYSTGGAVRSSAALTDRGTVGLGIYIGSDDNYLYLLDGSTGSLIDRFLTYGQLYTSPSVADVDGDGRLEIFLYDAGTSGVKDNYTFWAIEDTGSTVPEYSIEWQMFRHDASRTGNYAGPRQLISVFPKDNTFNETTPLYSRFNVTVWVENVLNVSAWQVKMFYDPTLLTATNAWRPIWDTKYVFFGKTSTETPPNFGADNVLLGDALESNQPAFNGTGILCVIEFEITQLPPEGTRFFSDFNIDNTDTYLLDINLVEIPVIKTNGNYAYYNKTNLVATGIEPVQVVWDDAIDLVQDKATDFNISYYSTFDEEVEVDIRVEAPDFDPSAYQFRQKLLPGDNSFVIGSEHAASPFFMPRNKPEVTFRFAIDPGNLIPETNETDNIFPHTGFESSNVIDTRRLNILFVPVRFTGEDGHPGYFNGFTRTEFVEHATESVKYIKATYPVAESEVSSYLACFNAPVDAGPRPTTELEANLTMLFLTMKLALRGVRYYDRVVGVVRTGWFNGIPGWSGPNWATLGYSYSLVSRAVVVSLGYWKTTPHEIGHTYSLEHSNRNGVGYYVVGRRSVNNQTFMSTGAILNPPPEPGYEMSVPSFWVRSVEYQRLLDALREPGDPEILFVSGTFGRNGTVELGDWYHFHQGTPDFAEGSTGNYSIVQTDGLGNELSVVGFNVSFVDWLHNRSYEVVPFAFSIPYASGMEVVEIRNATGHVVAGKIVSAHAPTVNVISPNGGEILTSDHVQISWQASDADGDTLVYNLLVSGDGGLTWNPIATGLSETTYDLPLTGFSGGDKYLVKVIASDGVNTGEDQSDWFFSIASFALEVLTPPQTVSQGGSANYTLRITSYGGFNSTIALNASSPTTNNLVYHWVNGSTIDPVPNGVTTVILEVEATDVTEGGNHTLLISGTSGNNTEVAISYLFTIAHDIAITNLKTSETIIEIGSQLYVNATVENQGTFTETPNIGLSCNQTTIGSQKAYLHVGTSTVLGFIWDTADWARGKYAISAYANPVPNETDIADNTLFGGWVIVGDETAPNTSHDYDGLWHNADFTITLTATDDLSGVAETYYRINNGPTQNISAHGQPHITIEGANNTLEYWSVDKAENEELPHKVLTGIKLDKTAPTANAGQNQTVNAGATITFDAEGSSDNIGIVSYEWDFGDGTNGTGIITTHTYTSPGNYTVTLTVSDAAGNTATHKITVTVLPVEFPMWVVGAIALIIAIAVAATFLWKRRKRVGSINQHRQKIVMIQN